MEGLEFKETMPLSFESKSKDKLLHSNLSGVARETLSSKHVLRIKQVLSRPDPQRRLYPHGFVSELAEDDFSEDHGPVTRIELFARNERTRKTYGVVRKFFSGYSRERRLLDLANFSNNVISVRAMPNSSKRERSDGKPIEDKLVLRRMELPNLGYDAALDSSNIFSRPTLPSIYVSSRWLDRMDLQSGDRIIVSNTVENYVAPPPRIAGAN
jgi:hypothetical protein